MLPVSCPSTSSMTSSEYQEIAPLHRVAGDTVTRLIPLWAQNSTSCELLYITWRLLSSAWHTRGSLLVKSGALGMKRGELKGDRKVLSIGRHIWGALRWKEFELFLVDWRLKTCLKTLIVQVVCVLSRHDFWPATEYVSLYNEPYSPHGSSEVHMHTRAWSSSTDQESSVVGTSNLETNNLGT